MADYRSTLTGTQMDSALLDMAEHNSEAYAVGERNGIAVASDDVTYHNNARYYAQIASSQIVGDASSAVRWDTDQSEALTDAQKAQARENINAASDSDVVKITAQTLTSAEQAQARANIMAGGSNRNLLDNPWFTVRQRGDGPFTSGYNVDRWVSKSNATVTLNASGTLTWATSSTYREFKQKIANPTYYANGTYTVSVNVVSATDVPWVILHNGNNGEILRKSLTVGMNSVTFTTGDSGIGMFGVYNLTHANISVELKAVKLELGSVSTLANDVPPDYGTELAKCQRYLRAIYAKEGGTYIGVGIGTTTSIYTIEFPFSMRATPVPSLSGTIDIYAPSGMHTVSSVAAKPSTTDTICLDFTVNGTVSVYEMGHFNIYNNTRLLLSAEL